MGAESNSLLVYYRNPMDGVNGSLPQVNVAVSLCGLRELVQVLEEQEHSDRWAPFKKVVARIDILLNVIDGKTCKCNTTEELIGNIGASASSLATRLRIHGCLLEATWIKQWAVDLESGIVDIIDKHRRGLPEGSEGVDDLVEPLRKVTHALEAFQVEATGKDWAQLTDCDREKIRNIMKQSTPWRGIERVAKDVAQAVLDDLQIGRDEARNPDSHKKYVKCLRVLSKKYSILPSQLYFDKSAIVGREQFQPGGTFSDISRATLVTGNRRQPICLKRLRICGRSKSTAFTAAMKVFTQEAFIWRQLSHENILPFYGITEEVMNYPSLCLISPWMEDGSVNDFLDRNPDYDRLRMVWDIASGIEYLHGLDPCIIHKDIRGPNILVGPAPHHRCCLADFGISLIAETQKPAMRERGAGNVRWTAPELLLTPNDYEHALLWSADIYSFGCTIIEIYTGNPPYFDVENDGAVMNLLHNGTLPGQPAGDVLPSALWHRVVELCLSHTPAERLTGTEILDALKNMDSPSLKEYRIMIMREAMLKRTPSSSASSTDDDDDSLAPEEGA